MPLLSNPLTDAINAARQKEIERILPNVEHAYENYEKIETETALFLVQVQGKLDQLAVIAPAKAEEIAQFRQALDELENAVTLWTLNSKYQLSTLVN